MAIRREAAVIEPRQDCEIYVERALAEGLRITRLFETHRHEDLVSGAPIFAEFTGARVLHGPYAAGDAVSEEMKDAAAKNCHELADSLESGWHSLTAKIRSLM